MELLRNNIGLNEHLTRFSPGVGKYSGIPLKEWVVVNFVEGEGDPCDETELAEPVGCGRAPRAVVAELIESLHGAE